MNRTPVADWQRLSALYELADGLDPPALERLLARLRTETNPLLPQLQQMLSARAQVQENDFLGALPRLPDPMTRTEADTGRRRAEPLVEWTQGRRIGPYRLDCKLGTGGMAEVWLADRDDGAFERQVAIKLLFRHAGSHERDGFARRFARERDILASLHHPNIAGLHDAGVTPEGQPWLALEYVEGETLAEWCDAGHLGLAERVRLFRQVLLAVQHAHANLVIHRDLKPGNILVTPQGEVRLLDFGIAKLMEPESAASVETELTRMAGRPMTPQYASPEQLLGQPLTTACDVYSLGVVLYELLCGERPYELKMQSAAQLEQAIVDTEPRAPSRRALPGAIATARSTNSVALRKALASDLDAIVLRALAKRPEQRYASAEAFRADLDRWLQGEAVEARTPSAMYRLGKFIRRHTLSVSLAVSAVVALAAVAAVAVFMGIQARQDSARAMAARDFMLNIFARASQEKARGADITARDLLETGRKDVLTRLAGQPALQAELLRGIAKIQSDMGEYVAADSTFAEWVRTEVQLRRPLEEARARAQHALNALQMNNLALARKLLEDAQAVTGRSQADPELDAMLTEVKGWVALVGGHADQAAAILRAGRDGALASLGPNHPRTFRLGKALFKAERDQGHFTAAVDLLESLRRSAPAIKGLDADELANLDWEQVNLLTGAGRFAQAAALVEVALPHCIQALGAEEQICRMLFLNRAQISMRLGKVEQTAGAMERLHAMSLDATLPYIQVEAMLLEFRIRSQQRNSPAETLELFERLRAFALSDVGNAMKPTFRAAALLAIAEARLRAGDPSDAQRWIDQAMQKLGSDATKGAGLRFAAVAHMLSGVALLQTGRAEAALDRLQASRIELAAAFGQEHPATLLFGLNAALALAELHRVPEALAMAARAEPVLRDALGADSPVYRIVEQLKRKLEEGKTPAAGAPAGRDFFS